MNKVEEIRTAYKEGHKRMMGEGYKCSCDICDLLSVIDRQTPVVEAAKEWSDSYSKIKAISFITPEILTDFLVLCLKLNEALSDMEKEVPSE